MKYVFILACLLTVAGCTKKDECKFCHVVEYYPNGTVDRVWLNDKVCDVEGMKYYDKGGDTVVVYYNSSTGAVNSYVLGDCY